MSRSDTRYSIYPAPKAVEVVGNSSPALNQAIECWAALLARAMADNARTFSESYEELVGDRMEQYPLHDWALLADVLKDKRFEPDFANPGELLATAVEDAHRLDNVGDKWHFGESEHKDRDAAVGRLAERLRKLDYAHAWGVIVAVQWFWQHHGERIDIKKNPWWTLAFRRRWNQNRSGKQQRPAIRDEQRAGTRGNKKTPSK
jgi:hypothetical protein